MAGVYDIRYSPEAVADIESLRAFDTRRILDGIAQHLRYGPKAESRSRIKRMRQPFWSHFRLRVDEFRVYYDVDDEQKAVQVLRVLTKTTESTPGEHP
jgi:mRNA-degrading endonuclease RelE of RelBE toxin-antitoxin system